jgi:oligopeptide transport system substrate-binding protein
LSPGWRKWENKDNTVWTFHLRPGVTWSDGTAITAQDFVWSWQRLVDPKTASPMPAIPAICISPTPPILLREKSARDAGRESAG